MAVEYHIYDQKFFQNTLKLEADSASAAVAVFYEQFKPKSVIDIGCGCGIYLKHFVERGVEIVGYDGSPAALKESLVGDKIKMFDLAKPLRLKKKFDLALCLEVAEHLEEKDADTLVETLTNLSETIIFTAAVPGQGPRSIGHINEQWPEYWIAKFAVKDFVFQKELTARLKAKLKNKNVVWWLTQNLMIFSRQK
ncbi:MAG: class I SAM-dependent methyltransferase [Patescibacteria group bacterium]